MTQLHENEGCGHQGHTFQLTEEDYLHNGGIFDPGAWLNTLVQIGGGYALASGRKLWLVVRDCPVEQLTTVMAQLIGHPERVEDVRTLIERRQIGEVA